MPERRVTWTVTETTTYSAVIEYDNGADLLRRLPANEHDGHWEAGRVLNRSIDEVAGSADDRG